MRPILSIIIINWNTQELTLQCLNSLAQALVCFAPDSVETIVVDNGSQDGSVPAIAAQFPWVKLLVNQHNLGFAGANNQAIMQSSGKYVLLLNSDTVVPPGALYTLIGCMEAAPQIGVCGPMLLNADYSFQAGFADFPTLSTEIIHQLGLAPHLLSPNYPSYRLKESQQQREVDWVGGACFLVRRAAIEQVGLLDEDYFMYSEEMDWCYRMKKLGWKVLYYPDAPVIHLGGRSSMGVSAWKYVQIQRSKVRFFAKHRGQIQARLLALTIRFLSFMKIIVTYLVGRDSPKSVQRRTAYWLAARTAL